MDALSVITLQEAKDHLTVDFADHDALITRLIKTSVALVEQHTQHRLYNRDVTKAVVSEYEVYDYPYTLTSVKDAQGVAVDYSVTHYPLSDKVKLSGCRLADSPAVLTINTGYLTRAEIPEPLVEACYSLIAIMYENRSTDNRAYLRDVLNTLNYYRRDASI